ncbi:MAG: TIGR00282 family metallophosphoesterase [Ruminococcaceae bacterium]|nr:TIGR00282 family metallophosphoesterase [Oscillospiraceae bacterium]
MNVLCVGDVVGHRGCELVRRVLPALKRQYAVDVCIVNGENSADGNGITPVAARSLRDSGADVITGGNHTFRRHEFYELLDSEPWLLRPANFPAAAPGAGMYTVDRGRYQVTVINLIGTAFMEPLACPFDTLDSLLKQAGNPKFCVVDFHAEATAEKKALAFYADGRVSALFGTHTHVPTADEQILPAGTGYITDVGMSGPVESVLGIRPELSIAKMHGKLPVRFAVAEEGPCELQAVLFTLDDKTGKTTAVQRIAVR